MMYKPRHTPRVPVLLAEHASLLRSVRRAAEFLRWFADQMTAGARGLEHVFIRWDTVDYADEAPVDLDADGAHVCGAAPRDMTPEEKARLAELQRQYEQDLRERQAQGHTCDPYMAPEVARVKCPACAREAMEPEHKPS